MITVHISKNNSCNDARETIEKLIMNGLKSIEVDIKSDLKNNLVFSLNEDHPIDTDNSICLEELFKWVVELNTEVHIILNFKEPNLESRAYFLVEEWNLREQVKYSGNIMPGHFSAWTRLNVIYNVENCLPHIHQVDQLKKAHLNVINYFCKKYQVKTIRIPAHLLMNEVIVWCDELDLKLSVSGVENLTEANRLEEAGATQISINRVNEWVKVD